MIKGLIVFCAFIFCSYSWAVDLKLNNLEISNRAQCAVDSAKVSKSAFLILEGYNAGRLSHGLAKSMRKDADVLAAQGVKEFRLSVAGLQNIIVQKLLAGKLPLLPANLMNSNLKYSNIADHCKSEVYCPELSKYLNQVWKASEDSNTKAAFAKIDNFSEVNFLKQGEAQNKCYLLKKFSPLQSHLYGQDINRAGLNSLAKALVDYGSYITGCDDKSDDIESESVALQLEILTNSKRWDAVGFDFWNSVKIYLSWSWRNAEELKKFAPKFNQPFRNIDLEESLLLVSNGCKSLTEPKCDAQNLSLNSLRELAKVQVQSDEFDHITLDGPEKQMFRKGARSVNNDFMALADYDRASGWVKNFSGNFQDRQTMFQNRLLNAHQFYSALSSKYSADQLAATLRSLKQMDSGNMAFKHELYYMCTEWSISARDLDPEEEQSSFLRPDILKVAEVDEMLRQSNTVGRTIPQQIGYYNSLVTQVGTFCTELDNAGYFSFEEGLPMPTANGYKAWAKEMLTPIQVPDQRPVLEYAPDATFLMVGDAVLCRTAIDCARNVMKYAVDLLNVSKFSEGFLSAGHIQSSEMLNPYNELTACKIYDPWFEKTRVKKRFVGDLVNTAAVGATGLPIYIDVNFTPNRVTSFKSMIENGQIKFDPNVVKGGMQASILADLGPLAGAPCALQVSPNANRMFDFYSFGGITINACKASAGRGTEFSDPRDPAKIPPKDRSGCVGCTINLIGASSSASYFMSTGPFNPLKFGAYLFRSMHRFFKGMKDPVNVPRSYVINLDLLQSTFNQYGGIPSACVKSIKKGKVCKENFCEARATMALEKETGKEIKSVNIERNRDAYVADYRDQCGLEFKLTFKCDAKTKSFQVVNLDKDRKRKNRCGVASNRIGPQ